MSHDFEYSDKFNKGMLEPSIVDFARRNPINTTSVTPVDNPTQQIQQTQNSNAQPSLSQQTQQQPCNVNLLSENNNIMSVNNVSQTFAQQIEQQAPQISPDIYMQQQPQMVETGPTLNLTIGGMGFINTLLLVILSGFIIGVLLIIVLYILK